MHENPKDPERGAHFHVYLEFNEKLERIGHDWSDTFNIKLPGSEITYKPRIESRKSLKEWTTWIGYCCKDKAYVASTYLNPAIHTYAKNQAWVKFMDSVYKTAEIEGPDKALDKLREENESYFYRVRTKLKPELEELHRAWALDNPKLYMPYKEGDFDWPQCLINLRVALEGWDKGLMNLPSMVFLGPSNTGKSAAIKFILRKYILRGEVLIINSIEGLEGFRHGKHRLILMEDPVFGAGGSLRVTTDVLEALLSVDQQRDMRVMYKYIQKPVNIPVIISGNPEKTPVELGGTDDITGILRRFKSKKDKDGDSEETVPESRVDLDNVEFEVEAGIHRFDENIPASIIKRRFIFYLNQPVLKPEAAAHYARQKEALMNPLQKNGKKRYDLEAHMEKLPEMKRLLSTEVVKTLRERAPKPVRTTFPVKRKKPKTKKVPFEGTVWEEPFHL